MIRFECAAAVALYLCVSAPAQTPAGDGLFYSAASIVNSASHVSGALAPYTLATVYGENLSRSIRALQDLDLQNGHLPTVLAGVRVLIGGLQAGLFYVSPQQVNFLVPGNLVPGDVEIVVTRDGRAGPRVRVRLYESAPGFFPLSLGVVLATHIDGRVVTAEDPAHPGQIVVLYATGLGRTEPAAGYRELPRGLAWVTRFEDLDLSLAGRRLGLDRVLYAGLAPGFAGLYQLNLLLPDDTPPDPEIRLGVGGLRSPEGATLPVR
jgi:uncharacterized protein (TIGR03437 family)